MSDDGTTALQKLIDRLRAGDPQARDELLRRAYGRMQRLARKLSADFERVRRWTEPDDVLHNALIRLMSALESVEPVNVQLFFGLAAQQIRRELIDLARRYYGPEGLGANYASRAGNPAGGADTPATHDPRQSTNDPRRLGFWTEFHEAVQRLPQEERDVVDLLWYHELTQAEAAALLDLSHATLKRRWLAARRRLQTLWPE